MLAIFLNFINVHAAILIGFLGPVSEHCRGVHTSRQKAQFLDTIGVCNQFIKERVTRVMFTDGEMALSYQSTLDKE